MPPTASIPLQDEKIRKSRVVTGTLTLRYNGSPIAGREVTVEQVKHHVLFGSNWGDSVALINGELSGERKDRAESRLTQFLDVFNMVTMPFYWAFFEPQRGQPDTRRILNASRWFSQQGLVTKGHTLCWHTLTASWLLNLPPEEIRKQQLERIRRDVADFAGVIDMWDVVNEAVIMPVFDKYENGITQLCQDMGRLPLIRATFDAARSANPRAVLLLNDFDTSPAFDILVEGCLEAGIQIDVIGIQSHMHQGYWGPEKTEHVLAQFERFHKPIHFTETTIVSGHLMPPEIVDLNDYKVKEWPSTSEGEARQAEEVTTHYKPLMAHPLVEAITWWDFVDGSWLGAPGGLLRRDCSPKPAYEALRGLVKGEWWLSPTRLVTDAAGQVAVSAFPGEYVITIDGQVQPFTLMKGGENHLTITC